jgi:hypothetical protein
LLLNHNQNVNLKSMKQLKNVLAIMVMAFGLMITTNACRDPCKDVNCNNGTCEEGTCKCETGWEGDNCDVAWRQKFVGNFRVSGSDTDGDQYSNVPVKIEVGAANAQAVIITFNNAQQINGSATSSTNISIPSQTVDGAPVEGSITGGNNSITMTLKVGGTQPGNYTMTLTGNRQ